MNYFQYYHKYIYTHLRCVLVHIAAHSVRLVDLSGQPDVEDDQ